LVLLEADAVEQALAWLDHFVSALVVVADVMSCDRSWI
jgi:hypothetical protein